MVSPILKFNGNENYQCLKFLLLLEYLLDNKKKAETVILE